MSKPVLGLQLYTVRSALNEDYVGTLKEVREAGYDAVEMAGAAPMSGRELKGILDDLGLRVAGMHVALDPMLAAFDDTVQLANELSTMNLVVPFLPEDRRKSRDDWLKTASLLDETGARCRAAGLQLSYHNHSFEFVKLGDQYALDLLFGNTSPQNVKCELDTYWIRHGGEDPVAYINRYAGRIVILHVKDMAGNEARSFTEIGQGILDWHAIHEAATAAGAEWYCVEQDICPGAPIESARISAKFIREQLGV